MSDAPDKPPLLPPRGAPPVGVFEAHKRRLKKERKKKPSTAAGRKRGGHGSAPRTYDRLKRTQDLLTLCYSVAEIQHMLAEEWNVSPHTVSKYIQECYAIWRRDIKPDEDERNRTAEALAGLFRLAVKDKQYGKGVRALEVRARILGLYEERVQIANVVQVINQNAAEQYDLTKAPDAVLDWIEAQAREKIGKLEAPKTKAPPNVVGDAKLVEK